MSLEQKIIEDIKQAMLAKEKEKLEALRAVKAAILLAKTEKGSGTGELKEETEMKILQKLVKQRRESAAIFKEQNRSDLADIELYQAGIIEAYLPAKLSPEEVLEEIRRIISDTGASSMKDMGKVMGMATKKLAGKADNKDIAVIVKDLLGG